jgi:hypothetical protein
LPSIGTVNARPVQRAEEGGEEHHLAEDEPAHAPAERHVDAVGVQAALALADGLAEPLEQHDSQITSPSSSEYAPSRRR